MYTPSGAVPYPVSRERTSDCTPRLCESAIARLYQACSGMPSSRAARTVTLYRSRVTYKYLRSSTRYK